jgi:dephospho-CoA kinase
MGTRYLATGCRFVAVGALHLGLTGGIGSGKSTVAGLLAMRGAYIIDADALSRRTTASGGEAIEPIRQTFGVGMVTPDGALNRNAMRSLVFSDPQAKQQLESIIHPLVGIAVESEVRTATANGKQCIVFDIPLLVESSRWRQRLDKVLVVDCLVSTQIARVVQRNGLQDKQVADIIESQAPRHVRLAAADAVLFNDGIDLPQLAQIVVQMAGEFGL